MLKKLPVTDSTCWQLSIILLYFVFTVQCTVSYPIAKNKLKPKNQNFSRRIKSSIE